MRNLQRQKSHIQDHILYQHIVCNIIIQCKIFKFIFYIKYQVKDNLKKISEQQYHPTMQPHQKIKIEQITPKTNDFQLHFEISQIITKDNSTLNCRVVDQTGIVNACFNKFVNKLEKGGVYLMTHLKCSMKDNRVRVENTQDTVISREPDIIGFKDRVNDISKKIFSEINTVQTKSQSQTLPHPTKSLTTPATSKTPGVIPETSSKKAQTLIPFTKQQALEQLRIQKQFQKNRPKPYLASKQPKQFKQKQKQRQKQKQKEQKTDKQKQKQRQNKNKHKDNDHNKIQYKQKNQSTKNKLIHQNQKKIQYKPKQPQQKYQVRINKTKSLLYQQKTQNKQKINKKSAYKDKKQDREGRDIKNQKTNTLKYKQKLENGSQDPQKTQKPYIQKSQNKNQSKSNQNLNENKQKQSSSSSDPKKQRKASSSIPLKKTQKKQGKGQCIDVINTPNYIGNCVNLKVWITGSSKKNQSTNQHQRLIADNTGAVWLRVDKINLQQKQYYQIDNLQVCKQQDRIFLKQDQLTQARSLQGTLTYNLKEINSKQ